MACYLCTSYWLHGKGQEPATFAKADSINATCCNQQRPLARAQPALEPVSASFEL